MATKSDQTKMWSAVIPGIILIAMGIMFLLNNYGYTAFDLSKLWPVFLIIPGVFMLFGIHHRRD